jgi:SAM-dependent methyltransferase
MGGNWNGEELTDDGERDYLRGGLSSVSGPVADVACGAGKWTKVICDTVGTSQVIGLDISRPLLRQCRATIPGLTAIRGSALALPFLDGTLEALTIWNALQQMPAPGDVIAEASRCLRPGGLMILLTYRSDRGVLSRYFQARHEDAFSVSSYSDDQMRLWLACAGLTPTDISGPANFLMVTARKAHDGHPAGSPEPTTLRKGMS